MKIRHLTAIFAAVATLLSGCGEKDPTPQTARLNVSPEDITFTVDGGSAVLTVESTNSWKASTDAAWVTVTPGGSAGSSSPVSVTVTAPANLDPERAATITISSNGQSKTVMVLQEGSLFTAIPKISIADFRKKNDSNSEWYRLSGEIVSLVNSQFGDFYMTDDGTNFVYVYGLAANESMTGNEDNGFSTLGLKAGDIVTIAAHKTTYQGIIETKDAYFMGKAEGKYPGYKAAKASASWLELPQTSGEDSYDYLCHKMHGGEGRSYSIYYSKADRLAKWVAYPLYSSRTFSRSDAYAFDPLVGEEDQPLLKSSYQDRKHNGEEFIRGHMLPSAERDGRGNLDVFLGTNIMPQSTELNNGAWGELEQKARNLTMKCDTLYVVIGTDTQDSKYKVQDTRSLEVVVPAGIYKAILAYTDDEGYRAMAVYFNNSKSDAKATIKSKSMSIDDLEKKLNIDLFPNLPDDIEKEIEAKNPAEDTWWW